MVNCVNEVSKGRCHSRECGGSNRETLLSPVLLFEIPVLQRVYRKPVVGLHKPELIEKLHSS